MSESYDNFIKLAIKEKPESQADFLKLKKGIAKRLGVSLPTNADIREAYEKMVGDKKITRNPILEKSMLTKSVRTQSGVAVVAVLTKTYPCPGQCIYCPTEKEMPKSYLSNEPAVMRAISAKFDPYLQVKNRLRALELNGHKTDKIELIIMGGTFSCFPKKYQERFITECFRACNEYDNIHGIKKVGKPKSESGTHLLIEQKRNETANHRIVGLTLETRPDYINKKEIINFRKLGCTRVELGVQSIFDEVLRANKRGHDVRTTITATELLKDAGFKINYHIMPGLLGSSLRKDRAMLRDLFSNPDFQPDILKIYPTVVVKNTPLYKLWRKNEYKPLTDKQFQEFIIDAKRNIIPPHVRIMRIVRDVPEGSIIAGPKISNLRQLIAKNSGCRCIRCREIGAGLQLNKKIILDRIEYEASGGRELFLQYVSEDMNELYALLRLRVPSDKNSSHPIICLRNAAIIREVHTYGKMTGIGKSDNTSPQHTGLGKKLVREAERITNHEFGMKKIVVISGVGVRDYYRKLGYRLKDSYMVKYL